MILRDAFQGLTRFDEFQKSLGVAPNILTRRLAHLVEAGLLQKRRYSDRPARHEYVLTEKGQDFFPVLMALFSWGRRHVPEEDLAFLLGDSASGKERHTKLVDVETGEELTLEIPACFPARRLRKAIATALHARGHGISASMPNKEKTDGSDRRDWHGTRVAAWHGR